MEKLLTVDEILNLPSSFDDFEHHPKIVYFLLNKNKVVYVGQSTRLGLQRAYAHRNKKFNLIRILKVKNLSDEEVRFLEDEYIFKYLPKYNKIISSKKKFKLIGTAKGTGNFSRKITAVKIGKNIYVKRMELE